MQYVYIYYMIYNSAFLYLELFKGLTPAAFNSLYKPPGHEDDLWTIQTGIFYCA